MALRDRPYGGDSGLGLCSSDGGGGGGDSSFQGQTLKNVMVGSEEALCFVRKGV